MAQAADYPTALYAAVHTGNSGDIDFYLDVCRDADTVLELGCGTGRIAHRLVEAGHQVVGLERDRQALAIAARHGAVPVAGDFTDFELEQRFKRIIIPYNGFNCLLSHTHMVRCLRAVERHLTEDGLLVFDMFSADRLAWESDDSDEPGRVASVDVEGKRFEVLEQSVIGQDAQRIDATYTHVPDDGGPPIVATINSRYILSHQVPELLGEAGLSLVALHGGFECQPFTPEADFMVVRAARWE